MSKSFNILDSISKTNLDIYNIILDFAGVCEYWKRRFTWDVLPKINKGYKLVSINNNKLCNSCYYDAISKEKTYGNCEYCYRNNSRDWDIMSFEEFKKANNNTNIYGNMHYINWQILASGGLELIQSAFRGCDYMNSNYKCDIKYDIKYLFYKKNKKK